MLADHRESLGHWFRCQAEQENEDGPTRHSGRRRSRQLRQPRRAGFIALFAVTMLVAGGTVYSLNPGDVVAEAASMNAAAASSKVHIRESRQSESASRIVAFLGNSYTLSTGEDALDNRWSSDSACSQSQSLDAANLMIAMLGQVTSSEAREIGNVTSGPRKVTVPPS